MTALPNLTYDQLTEGRSMQFSREVSQQHVQLFAAVSGDCNPLHLDAEFAASSRFGEPIAHGMICGAYISAAIGMYFPGPGTVYLGQELRFRLPVRIGDVLTVMLTVVGRRDKHRIVTLDCAVRNQDQELVTSGEARIMAPDQPITVQQKALPELLLAGQAFDSPASAPEFSPETSAAN